MAGATDKAGNKHSNCGGVHRPGDLLTCYVTFASKTDFSGLEVVFNLPAEEKPRRHGAYINFILRNTKKLDAITYAVSDALPDCVPGAYILAAVSAHTSHESQQYLNFAGGLGALQITVENDAGDPVAMERWSKQMELQNETRIPQIVETPPPDAVIFPRILSIRSSHPTTPPRTDLVHLVGGLFHRSDAATEQHNQGDTLAYRISFQGHPQFQTVTLHFLRDEKKSSRYEKQLCLGMGLGTQGAAESGDGSYEVTGTILKCAPGRYRLYGIGAFGYAGADRTKLYVKNYTNGTDFKSNITLQLRDTAHRTFPPILSVGPQPGTTE